MGQIVGRVIGGGNGTYCAEGRWWWAGGREEESGMEAKEEMQKRKRGSGEKHCYRLHYCRE